MSWLDVVSYLTHVKPKDISHDVPNLQTKSIMWEIYIYNSEYCPCCDGVFDAVYILLFQICLYQPTLVWKNWSVSCPSGLVLIKLFESKIDFDLKQFFSHCLSKGYTILAYFVPWKHAQTPDRSDFDFVKIWRIWSLSMNLISDSKGFISTVSCHSKMFLSIPLAWQPSVP